MKIKVIKRNSQIEDYDPEKIIKVVIATGLSEKEAKKLVNDVNKWLKKRGKGKVTSVQIRDQVIVEIQKINREAADKFIWYEKYRDKNFDAG